MAKRTVKTGLATYRNADGQFGVVGFQGDEVDVHSDDVKRFDELNVQPGGDDAHETPKQEVSMYTSPAAGAETSGTNSGLNTAVSDKEAADSTAGDDTGEAKPRSRKK